MYYTVICAVPARRLLARRFPLPGFARTVAVFIHGLPLAPRTNLQSDRSGVVTQMVRDEAPGRSAARDASRPDQTVATLPELVQARIAGCPDAVAVASPARALTYGDLGASANRLAAELRALRAWRREGIAGQLIGRVVRGRGVTARRHGRRAPFPWTAEDEIIRALA